MELLKALVEFFGTTVFLYVIIATGNPWLIGLTLAILIFLFGKFSGGNFNPAVTLMMITAKKESAMELLPYLIAQLLGAMTALLLYKLSKIDK